MYSALITALTVINLQPQCKPRLSTERNLWQQFKNAQQRLVVNNLSNVAICDCHRADVLKLLDLSKPRSKVTFS